MRGFFLVLGYLIGGGLSCGFAQPSYYANPFIEQIEHYPQEKLHVSTDKDSYIAGDTIWLRPRSAHAARSYLPRCTNPCPSIHEASPAGNARSAQ